MALGGFGYFGFGVWFVGCFVGVCPDLCTVMRVSVIVFGFSDFSFVVFCAVECLLTCYFWHCWFGCLCLAWLIGLGVCMLGFAGLYLVGVVGLLAGLSCLGVWVMLFIISFSIH